MIGFVRKSKAKTLFQKGQKGAKKGYLRLQEGVLFLQSIMEKGIIEKTVSTTSMAEEGEVFLSEGQQEEILEFLKKASSKEVSLYKDEKTLIFEEEEESLTLEIREGGFPPKEELFSEEDLCFFTEGKEFEAALKKILSFSPEEVMFFSKEGKAYIASVTEILYSQAEIGKAEREFSFSLEAETIKEMFSFKKGNYSFFEKGKKLLFSTEEKDVRIFIEGKETEKELSSLFPESAEVLSFSKEEVKSLLGRVNTTFSALPVVHLRNEEEGVSVFLSQKKEEETLLFSSSQELLKSISFSGIFLKNIPEEDLMLLIEEREDFLPRTIQLLFGKDLLLFGEMQEA